MTKDFRVLVIGCGRGGTTLLSSVLDAHPDLEVESEYQTKELFIGQRVTGYNEDRYSLCLDKFFKVCLARAQQRSPPKGWGNKVTTEQVRNLVDEFDFKAREWKSRKAYTQLGQEMMDSLFGRIPKTIFILRDGKACIASQMKRGRTWQLACENWKHSLYVLEHLRNHENAYVMRFEDLVLQPEETLKDISAFLEVPYHEDMLKGAIRPGRGYYKYEGFLVSKIEPDRVLPEECLDELQPYLEKYGYER